MPNDKITLEKCEVLNAWRFLSFEAWYHKSSNGIFNAFRSITGTSPPCHGFIRLKRAVWITVDINILVKKHNIIATTQTVFSVLE
ncbi:hypothetical protein CSV60_15375 [Sporosarcina sp. P7]|nr:hypothetical protein CSV60_15375 [Sporosarcina sp. P7]